MPHEFFQFIREVEPLFKATDFECWFNNFIKYKIYEHSRQSGILTIQIYDIACLFQTINRSPQLYVHLSPQPETHLCRQNICNRLKALVIYLEYYFIGNCPNNNDGKKILQRFAQH